MDLEDTRHDGLRFQNITLSLPLLPGLQQFLAGAGNLSVRMLTPFQGPWVPPVITLPPVSTRLPWCTVAAAPRPGLPSQGPLTPCPPSYLGKAPARAESTPVPAQLTAAGTRRALSKFTTMTFEGALPAGRQCCILSRAAGSPFPARCFMSSFSSNLRPLLP